jgi:hypothetical protein
MYVVKDKEIRLIVHRNSARRCILAPSTVWKIFLKFIVFWHVALCSHVEVDRRRFRGASIIKEMNKAGATGEHVIEESAVHIVHTFETSAKFNVTTRHYILEDYTSYSPP